MKRLGVAAVFLSFAALAAAQPARSHGPVEVRRAVRWDVSPPLRDIPVTPPRFEAPHERPRPLPFHAAGLPDDAPDPVAQTSANVLVAATTGPGFDGVGVGFTGPAGSFSPDAAPPDTNGAVGPTQYVQWVNESFAVFDKTGSPVYGPTAGNTLWDGFGGPCETNNDGDPIAQYDRVHDRWVMSQFSVSSTPYMQCFAVSASGDATGSWYRYAFTEPSFNDYPKIGIWPDGYYATYNMFTSTFQGGRVCAYDSAKMIAGQAATEQCFQLSRSYGGLLPSDADFAPPAGAPNYVVNFGANSLNVWKFHVDWATPANTTLSEPLNLPVAAFSAACGGGACIPQPGKRSGKLDSLADRLMYRLAYSNLSGQESLVVNHSVKASSTRKSETDGIRWYEIRIVGGVPSIYQQGTFSPDASNRWMGSAARDKAGNIAIGYSVSSTSVYPSVRYTGRQAADTPGTLGAEASLYGGSGSQGRSLNRWGDYSSLSVDPVDGCTMWYTTEYLKTDGTFNWSTRIGTIKFPNCN